MYYAYYIEETKKGGIVESWDECQKLTKGKKSRYKKFKTEKDALSWLDEGAKYEVKNVDKSSLNKSAIFFDAGTGRGIGVEVRITDFHGNSLLPFILDEKQINEFGNYLVAKGRTNNFGELTGLYAALKYALKYDVKDICGDSELVIKYWSKGQYNEENLEKDTIKLIKKVTELVNKFTKLGGKIHKISGDVNPADLGFHK